MSRTQCKDITGKNLDLLLFFMQLSLSYTMLLFKDESALAMIYCVEFVACVEDMLLLFSVSKKTTTSAHNVGFHPFHCIKNKVLLLKFYQRVIAK